MKNLLLIICVSWFIIAPAQLNFENFSSQNTVNDLLKDGDYIWVATTGGVFKRDQSNGHLVAAYTTKEGLTSNNVQTIAKDLDGNIWFGTQGRGISVFNPNNGTWKQWYKNEFNARYVTDIVVDVNGDVWVSSYFSGILKYDKETHEWSSFWEYNNRGEIFYSLLIDDIGNLWTGGYYEGLFCLKINGDTVVYKEGEGTISAEYIHSLEKDNNGNIWITHQSTGVDVYNLSDDTWSYFTTSDGLPSNAVYDITVDAHDNIWLATWDGLSKYDGSSFTNYTESDGLAKDYVKCLISDANANIWAGTGYGLSKFNYDDNTFNTPIRSANSLVGNTIHAMACDTDGEMWFATDNGCSRYNPNTKKWLSYSAGNYIFGLATEDDSLIWLGVKGDLLKYNKIKDKWVTPYSSDKPIYTLAVDDNHKKWMGSYDGFYIYEDDGTVTHYSTSDGLIGDYVYCFNFDSEGNAWIGTRDGLSKFDGTNFTNYDDTNTENAIDGSVKDIFIGENDTIYVVSWNGGLATFDGTSWVRKIPGYYNRTVQIDEFKNIWLGTAYWGMKKQNNGITITYTVDDGLPVDEVKNIIFDNNKDLWIGTEGGVSHVTSQKPNTQFNYDTICYGLSNTTTHLINTSEHTDDLTTYAWDIDNDGITDYTSKDLNYNFQHPGLFPVTLIVSNDLASDTIRQDVRVYENPEITLSPGMDQEICAGTPLQFTATPISDYRPIFVDAFNYNSLNASLWKVGGEGAENWSVVDTNILGNSELYFYWKPEIIGEGNITSPVINTEGADSLFLYFDQMLDFYADTIKIGIRTSSDGINWTDTWSKDVTTDITVEQKKIIIKNSDVGSTTFYIQFYFMGRSYNLDGWHIDNVALFKTDVNTQYFAPYKYYWSNGARSRDMQVVDDGRYSVTVANKGCIYTSEEIRVKFIKPLSPKICIVTVDTSSDKNLIVWEKPNTNSIDKYIIYREQGTNDYISIGEVDYGDLSEFIDIGSSPNVHADKYKISIIDTCGNESELSPYHQTMNLSQAMGASENEVILIWNKYEDESGDFVPSTYNIYRKESGLDWTLETTLTGSLSTFNYNLKDIKKDEQFIISVDIPTCTPTKASGGPYYQSSSNIEDEGIIDNTSINTLSSSDNDIAIYPNPNNGYFTINFSEAATGNISIYNSIGQVIYVQSIDNQLEWQPKEALAKGVYLLKINIGHENITRRIVVN